MDSHNAGHTIKKCFICYKKNHKKSFGKKTSFNEKCDSEKEDEERMLKEELIVVFTLRRLFTIPEATCCQFLQQYGNPSSWIYCCDSCSGLVDEAKDLFDRVTLLERKINTLKQNLESKIRSSVKREEHSDQTNNVKTKGEPTEIVRALIMLDIFHDSEIKKHRGSDDKEYLGSLECSTGTDSDSDISNGGQIFGDDDDSSDFAMVDSSDVTEKKFEGKDSVQVESSKTTKSNVKNGGQNFDELTCLTIPLPKYKDVKDFQTCPLCFKSFSTKEESYNHLLTHPPPCPYCSEQLLNRDEFKSHVITHRMETIKVSKCCVCYQDFKSYVSILEHKCNRVVYDIKPKLPLKTETPSSSDELYKCSICDEEFTNNYDFTNHKKTHRIFNCSDCGKTFSKKCYLQSHKLTHTDPAGKPFKCSTCGKAFAYEHTLHNHEYVHKEDNPFRCTVCGKHCGGRFCLSDHMKTHTQDKDSIERPFQCATCKKSFSTLKSLITHERYHTTEKTHTCQFCDKKFAFKGNKDVHERTHTGEKPFACSFCEERFSERCQLKKHLRTHTGEPPPLQCSFCDKRFEFKKEVKAHERTHTGEKPYSCAICAKSFADSGGRRRHVRMVHEKVPGPNSCPVCKKRFHNKADLKRHENVHL